MLSCDWRCRLWDWANVASRCERDWKRNNFIESILLFCEVLSILFLLMYIFAQSFVLFSIGFWTVSPPHLPSSHPSSFPLPHLYTPFSLSSLPSSFIYVPHCVQNTKCTQLWRRRPSAVDHNAKGTHVTIRNVILRSTTPHCTSPISLALGGGEGLVW